MASAVTRGAYEVSPASSWQYSRGASMSTRVATAKQTTHRKERHVSL